jgi:uroporphyrinogen decarboxylase
MRQAGRYLPEYRALREEVDFLTATKTPEIAARITLQPMERFELDAAILFSDIMTPLEGMGVGLRFAPGPIIDEPVRSVEQARALRALDPDRDVPFVMETLSLIRSELRDEAAVIVTWWRAEARNPSWRRGASCDGKPRALRFCWSSWASR